MGKDYLALQKMVHAFGVAGISEQTVKEIVQVLLPQSRDVRKLNAIPAYIRDFFNIPSDGPNPNKIPDVLDASELEKNLQERLGVSEATQMFQT